MYSLNPFEEYELTQRGLVDYIMYVDNLSMLYGGIVELHQVHT